MPFEPKDVTKQESWESFKALLDGRWLPVLEQRCDFPPQIFEDVTLNLIRNPNFNSSLLFRADILYDSDGVLETATEDNRSDVAALKGPGEYKVSYDGFPGFVHKRTVVRRMIPRKPQLDINITQTCQIFQSEHHSNSQQTVVLCLPHVAASSEIPWYHPAVQCLAYLHTWQSSGSENESQTLPDAPSSSSGNISLHYRPFPEDTSPLSDRLLRTAHHLLSTLYKHGQATLNGYTKRVLHDQVVSQQRVQDTYTRLKATHAKRLCDHWAEQTDSSKHVFEDLSIAAFLIELWKDMYQSDDSNRQSKGQRGSRNYFPGFVDIGCGNGVLVDILLREGYKGWGFDARNRKSWATFDKSTQRHLKELILVPQPLLEMNSTLDRKKDDPFRMLSKILPKTLHPVKTSSSRIDWHNGVFPRGTFIISNHADELTPWTPLLAHLSSSPFLAIPCCSHNLSGLRFRAPSKFNGYSADTLAPKYFAANMTKSKSVAITIAANDTNDGNDQQPKNGSLKDLSPANRAKQPSAYAALCDWVAHLSTVVGYEIEKEMLRLPSTRNTGLIGRRLVDPALRSAGDSERMEKVKAIAGREGADGVAWVERANGLTAGKGEKH
ncbi:MAG: hypothetical protein Q9220_000070 [cf. Caloplaca sp. 1 TL-2023]